MLRDIIRNKEVSIYQNKTKSSYKEEEEEEEEEDCFNSNGEIFLNLDGLEPNNYHRIDYDQIDNNKAHDIYCTENDNNNNNSSNNKNGNNNNNSKKNKYSFQNYRNNKIFENNIENRFSKRFKKDNNNKENNDFQTIKGDGKDYQTSSSTFTLTPPFSSLSLSLNINHSHN
ncbi:hypothetical protein ACTFIW_005625 [Dictyostelium discoideum]